MTLDIRTREEAFAVLILHGLHPVEASRRGKEFHHGWYVYFYPFAAGTGINTPTGIGIASGAGVCVGFTPDVDRNKEHFMSWGAWVQKILDDARAKQAELRSYYDKRN